MEKLVDRILKLLALARNNPSEAEAAAAIERASALMAQHNLSMAEVTALGADEERTEVTHKAEKPKQTWARPIWTAVADLNFCFHCYRRSYFIDRTDNHILVGTPANVQSTKLMALYLVETVERLARECKEAIGSHAKHAFKLGCAARLSERLSELRQNNIEAERAVQSSEPSTTRTNLPTLAGVYDTHDAANEEFYKKLHGRMPRSGRGVYTTNPEAFGLGVCAGDDIGLDPQLKDRSFSPLESASQSTAACRGSEITEPKKLPAL